MPIGLTKIDGGEFTLEEDLGGTSYESITINHNLGVVPKFIYLWTEEIDPTVVYEKNYLISNISAGSANHNNHQYMGQYESTKKTGSYPVYGNNANGFQAGIWVPNESSFQIKGIIFSTLPSLKGGIKYKWIAMA